MTDQIQNLPDRPVSTESIYELMMPPRCGIGLIVPMYSHAESDDSKCVAAYLEENGVLKGIYLNADGEWVRSSVTNSDLDGVVHNAEKELTFMNRLASEIKEIHGNDYLENYEPDIQFDAPVGFQSKLFLRHRKLSPSDFQEILSSPQCTDALPMYQVDNRLAGVVVSENPIGNSPPNTVFLYFHPDISTWRIVDSISSQADQAVLNQLHKETGDKIEQHYDDFEMILGPPDSTHI